VLLVPALNKAASAAISGDTAAVRHQVDSLGATGALIVFALALIHAIAFYPAEILNTAAGFSYGFWLALLLVTAAWLSSALLAYAIGHFAARPILYRLAGEDRFRRGERAVHRGGVPFLIAARLIPIVPFSIVGYVCGAARVPLTRYTWTTVVGYMPITAVFVYLGTRLESLSVTDPLLLGSAVVVIALFSAIWWLGPRLMSPDSEPT
jgi:uncharacterized membrane protein YdjX (TVP38/TMEM64 family)